ncbi:MAG TPA: alpha/beta fold hydrolase, partial [Woeseiaceae bacterium]|nr:alpha/beta fold hydrolase [Woeseiaceae bacterium]
DFTAGLDNVRVPTLCVWGDRDAFVQRSDQEQLVASIRRSRLTVYEGAGHALHWEEPARFAADLAGFVKELDR